MFLGMPDVTLLTGRCKSSVYKGIKTGDFPKPDIKDGKRSIGWSAATIAQWLENRGAPAVSVMDLIAARAARLEAERRQRLDAASKRRAVKAALARAQLSKRGAAA